MHVLSHFQRVTFMQALKYDFRLREDRMKRWWIVEMFCFSPKQNNQNLQLHEQNHADVAFVWTDDPIGRTVSSEEKYKGLKPIKHGSVTKKMDCVLFTQDFPVVKT